MLQCSEVHGEDLFRNHETVSFHGNQMSHPIAYDSAQGSAKLMPNEQGLVWPQSYKSESSV